jgi:hypothetical protein
MSCKQQLWAIASPSLQISATELSISGIKILTNKEQTLKLSKKT